MEIRYKCERCDKEVKAKVSKKAFKSEGGKGKKHNRVDCLECGRYIKFIGESELDRIKIVQNVDDFQEHPIYPEDGLAELNFKLDLIIDHLGVKND
jgi:hypothetical protein